MKDEKFLALPYIEARQYVYFQGEPEESRLKALYLAEKGIDLGAVREAAATPGDNIGVVKAQGDGLQGFGAALIVAGAAIALAAFFFDVGSNSGSSGLYGLPEKVANIDRIAIRHMIFASGLGSFVSGWVAVGAAHVAKAVRPRE